MLLGQERLSCLGYLGGFDLRGRRGVDEAHSTHQFSQVVIACHRVRIDRGFRPRSRIEPRC